MMALKKRSKRKKLPRISLLWNRAWQLQSKYIRLKYADFQGYVHCYTCDKVFHWTQLQAGHFVHQSYDFDIEANIRPQCTACNNWGHGKPLEYYLHLVQEIGKEAADNAKNRKHSNPYNRQDLLDLISKYDQALLRQMRS